MSSLKSKLLLVTCVMVVLIVVQAIVLANKASEVANINTAIKDSSSQIVAQSYQLKLAVVQVQQWLTDISATRGLDGLNDGFDQAAVHADAALGLMAELATLNADKAGLYRDMQAHFDAYYATGKRMAQAYVDGGSQAGNPMMGEFDAAAETLQGDVGEAMQLAVDLSERNLDRSVSLAGEVWTWVVGMSMLLLVIAGATGVYLYRGILNPICETARLANNLGDGDGDLTRRLDGARNDELGHLSRGINTFVAKIHETVVTMRSVATQLGDSSAHLTHVAQDGEAKAHNQLGETETVASAMTELKASADEIARTAADTAGHTQSASEQAENGNAAVQKAAGVIESLSTEIERAQAVINQLGEDSSAIGSVLDVIRGISEQTNLLALNAAIEAARAGEQGRGFAVVADEVRTLASRTQQSTAEIQSMISNLQSRAQESVEVMAGSRQMAVESVSEIEKARELLGAIRNEVSGIQDMTYRIATAAEEQSQVSGDMDRNVVRIADMARENANNAAGIASASNQLNELSSQISSLVGSFKTS